MTKLSQIFFKCSKKKKKNFLELIYSNRLLSLIDYYCQLVTDNDKLLSVTIIDIDYFLPFCYICE